MYDPDNDNINVVHSKIHEYPIDYDKYPLAKDCKEHNFQLNSGEFMIIPPRWLHWIFTKENTIAISYTIHKIDFVDTSNVFCKHLFDSKPYIGKSKKLNNMDYNKFINDSIDISFTCMYSADYRVCSVYKNYEYPSFKYYGTLKDIIKVSNINCLYAYIAMDPVKDNTVLNDYNSIYHLIDKSLVNNIDYDSYVWFTLSNEVDSGLHYDSTFNIIYVIEGQKNVKLFSPDCIDKMYISTFKHLEYANYSRRENSSVSSESDSDLSGNKPG
jgi:hypothetical protein